MIFMVFIKMSQNPERFLWDVPGTSPLDVSPSFCAGETGIHLVPRPPSTLKSTLRVSLFDNTYELFITVANGTLIRHATRQGKLGKGPGNVVGATQQGPPIPRLHCSCFRELE